MGQIRPADANLSGMGRTAFLAIVAVLLGWFTTVDAADLTGRASVIDGDTIEIHGQRIRLYGIDAPGSRQTCEADGRRTDAASRRRSPWPITSGSGPWRANSATSTAISGSSRYAAPAAMDLTRSAPIAAI